MSQHQRTRFMRWTMSCLCMVVVLALAVAVSIFMFEENAMAKKPCRYGGGSNYCFGMSMRQWKATQSKPTCIKVDHKRYECKGFTSAKNGFYAEFVFTHDELHRVFIKYEGEYPDPNCQRLADMLKAIKITYPNFKCGNNEECNGSDEFTRVRSQFTVYASHRHFCTFMKSSLRFPRERPPQVNDIP